MWKTVLRRLLIMIPQLIILSLLVFILAKMMPGDALTGQVGGGVDPKVIEEIRWIKGVLHGDFGKSFTYKLPVLTTIGPRAVNSFALSFMALIIMYAFAIPIGIFAGKNNGSRFDKIVVFLNFVNYAVPSFVMYLFAILIFGYKLGWFPTIGSVDSQFTAGTFAYYMSKLHHMIMPATCIAIISSVGTIQYLRNEVIDAKTQDYVKTAKSKGVPMRKIYTHHIFRNSLLPIAAFFGFQISGLLGGSVIAESIFNYQGMGKFFLEAIGSRDYSVAIALIRIFVSTWLIIVRYYHEYSRSKDKNRVGGARWKIIKNK